MNCRPAPVRPSTWPPPSTLRNSRGVGAQRLGSGVSCGEVFAEREETESVRMYSCATWTWQRTTTWTAGAPRWWQTDCLFTVLPSWPVTLQWCHPLHQDGRAKRGTAQTNGKALEDARRRKERTYPACRRRWQGLVGVLGRNSFRPSRGPRCANGPKSCGQKLGERSSGDGRGCWHVQPQKRSQCLFWASSLGFLMPSVHDVILEARYA